MANLSERMLSLRKEKKLNQEDAAKQSGLTFHSYRRYESGEREPNASTLWKLADFFNVTIDYLVGRTDDPGANL